MTSIWGLRQFVRDTELLNPYTLPMTKHMRRVWEYLNEHCDERGIIKVKQKDIAEHCGIHKSYVCTSIQALKDRGILYNVRHGVYCVRKEQSYAG